MGDSYSRFGLGHPDSLYGIVMMSFQEVLATAFDKVNVRCIQTIPNKSAFKQPQLDDKALNYNQQERIY